MCNCRDSGTNRFHIIDEIRTSVKLQFTQAVLNEYVVALGRSDIAKGISLDEVERVYSPYYIHSSKEYLHVVQNLEYAA